MPSEILTEELLRSTFQCWPISADEEEARAVIRMALWVMLPRADTTVRDDPRSIEEQAEMDWQGDMAAIAVIDGLKRNGFVISKSS